MMKFIYPSTVIFLFMLAPFAFADGNCPNQLWTCSISDCVDGIQIPLNAEGYSKAEAMMELIKSADRSGCGEKARNPEKVVCKEISGF